MTQTLGRAVDLTLVRHRELPLNETRVIVGGGRRSRRPGVEADVIVLYPGRHGERARESPMNDIEPQRTMVEGPGLLEIAHMKVHVSHARACGKSCPLVLVSRVKDALGIERIAAAHHAAVPDDPLLSRPIAVHLDAQPIGIRQVQRSCVSIRWRRTLPSADRSGTRIAK